VQLVLWTVALEALLLLFFAVVLLLVIQNSQNQRIEESLRLSAVQLNAVVDLHDGDYMVSPAETLNLRTEGILAWVISPEGELGMTIGETPAGLPYAVPSPLPALNHQVDLTLPESGEPVRLLVTPLSEGTERLGTLVVAISLRESQMLVQQILLGLMTTIPMVLLLSAAGGFFLANRALSPVAVITDTARQISAADLKQRIELDLPEDEIGRLTNTFNAMLERLEQAFQRERQLTSDVSHELRTPLGMLKTQLSLARSRPRDAATLLQMMKAMEEDVDRMTQLIEQMLTLARIEQRGLRHVEPVDLSLLLAEVTAQLQIKAQRRQVYLHLELYSQTSFELYAYEEQLRQVFSNLIDNAIKYAPTGGQVEIHASRHWQQLTISVSDNGAGIPPEQLPHLFERFYRVDDARTRDTGGFGLGLAIAQAIVKAHDGQIKVHSELGKGSTFTVCLPVKAL